ncbi:MAG TPA: SPOR domain-containing protein [Dokdonella sp.]
MNGKTWHRVRVGPYATASELEAAKRSLADNGIKAIALKETGP